jgi:hypothetical protein
LNKLFIAFILLAVFSANALVSPQMPKKDSDGCYLITNAAELYGFADMVNSRDSSEKICARLDADITINKNLLDPEKVAAAARDTVDTIPPAPSCLELEDPCELEKWVPIGKSQKVYYTGRFDGQGHTISGLYIDMPERDSVGFFGVAAYGATIENLNIVDSYIRGHGDVGGVAGYLRGRMYNSSFSGVVVGNGFVGGVVGGLYGYLLYCHNDGYVRGSSLVGGVAGGGTSATLDKCYNSASVFGTSNIGGLLGYGGNIRYSYNTGLVKGYNYIAGLIGEVFGTSDTVTHSFNYGKVIAGLNGRDIYGEQTFSSTYTNLTNNYSVEGARPKQYSGILDSATFASDSLVDAFNRIAFGLWKKGDRHPVFDEAAKPELKDSVYQIKTPAHLLWYADYVNYMFAYPNTSAILLDDIVFNKNVIASECVQMNYPCDFPQWIPIDGIRSLPDYYGYTGTFDGNGHSVSGLYVTSYAFTSGKKLAMFNDIDDRGVVKDLVLTDSYFGDEHLNIIAYENDGLISECAGKYYVDGTKYDWGAERVIAEHTYAEFSDYRDKIVQKYVNNDGLWFDGKRLAFTKREFCYYKDSTECLDEGYFNVLSALGGEYPRVLFPYKRMASPPRFVSRTDAHQVTMDSLGYFAYKYRAFVNDTSYSQSTPKEVSLIPNRYYTSFPDLEGFCLTYTSDHDMYFSTSQCGVVLPKTSEPKTVNLQLKDFERTDKSGKDTTNCREALKSVGYFYFGHRDTVDIEGIARIFELGPKGTCKGEKKIAENEPGFCYDRALKRNFCDNPDDPIIQAQASRVLPDVDVTLAGKTLLFKGFSAGATYDFVTLNGAIAKKGFAMPAVDVSDIQAGVYVVRVRDGARSLAKKVMLR